MNPRHLELADEFSKLVGKPHLLDYLGLAKGTSTDEARSELKKRRKYMQGMQSNPKFKAEALFLIKNFGALDALLHDPAQYLEAVSRQQESEHLPILEMTIRTVLKAGSLNKEQEEYLRRQARELGLSDQTFEDTLTRLAAQSGIARTDAPPRRDEDETPAEDSVEITDHYGILGITTNASREEIYDAYRSRYRTVRAMADREKAEELYRRLDRAWQVLSDGSSRETYDLSLRNTGPPARNRKKEDPFLDALRAAPTAPPVRPRTQGPDGTSVTPIPTPSGDRPRSRIEFVGARIRQVSLTGTIHTETLSLKVTDNLEARVTTDEPWLHVEPAKLEAGKREHTLQVRIDPRDVPAKKATAVITVQTEPGDRASVVFEVVRKRSPAPMIAGVLGVAGTIAALAALVSASGAWWDPVPVEVAIVVDPVAEDVLVDGRSVGGGARVVLEEPPGGPVTITVIQSNFKTWAQEVDLATYQGGTLPVRLELASDLSFQPTPELKQGTIDEAVLQQVMPPRTAAMDDCARRAAGPTAIEGNVRIFVGQDGIPKGVEMEGAGTSDPTLRDCLVRQAAAVKLPPVADGDYATVRYHYVVAEGTP